MAYKIYLSPSNQDGNTYATGNTNEMAQCDKIAKATATALRRCGFDVKVGKSGDGMAIRCKESDAYGADIHMPIHTNAYNGKVTGGTRIFCYSSSDSAPSKAVLKTLGAISPGTADSVSVRADLYEVNVPKATTVYVECEFHDTRTGSDWIINNITHIGEAICKGLCNHFGVTYKTGSSTTPSNPTTNKPTTNSTTGTLTKGTKLSLSNVALYVSSTAKMEVSTKSGTYYMWDNEVVNGRVRITNSTSNVGKAGRVTGWISESDAKKSVKSSNTSTSNSFKSYVVRITSDNGVNIRKGPGTNYAITGTIAKGGAYTIVEEKTGQGAKKWGKLKSGAGWIALDFTKKI